ncbi:MAG: hypothetical protein AB4426_00065 [Xenococcaceae cyanobacterium]
MRHFPEPDLLVLGLNSAWKLNHSDKYKSAARINPDALTNALNEINQTPTYRGSRLKMAVWHHPLNSPDEDRIKDKGFMQRLAQNGFRLALHGHIHKAGADDYKYRAGSQIDIIAAGTFGAPVRQWVPGYPLQYNLLRWQGNKLTVYTRKRADLNGVWQPDAMWVQADGLAANSYYEIELNVTIKLSVAAESGVGRQRELPDEQLPDARKSPKLFRREALEQEYKALVQQYQELGKQLTWSEAASRVRIERQMESILERMERLYEEIQGL